MLDRYLSDNMGRTKRVNILNDVNDSAARLDNSSDDTTVELELRSRSENTYDDDFCDFSRAEIYKQLRPLLICMRIFGLYFKRTVGRNRKSKTECVALFCGLINLVMICNVIRSFSVYRVGDMFDAVLVQRVLFTIWSSECATKGLLLMWYCYKQNGLPQFFREWAVTCNNARIGSLALTMMRKFIVLSVVFILFNSVGFTIIIMYVPVLGDIYHEVVWRHADQFEDQLVFKIVLGIFAVLNSSFSMFPVSLYVVLTLAISKQMKKFSNELETAISDNEFHGNIQELRLRHMNLCNMVGILDRVFSPMIGAVFSANIPMFCLVLFTMVTSNNVHVSLVLINLFWLSFILLQMFIVSIAAAYVSVKVSVEKRPLFVFVLFCCYFP